VSFIDNVSARPLTASDAIHWRRFASTIEQLLTQDWFVFFAAIAGTEPVALTKVPETFERMT